MDDELKTVKESVSLAREIVQLVKDNPEAKEAGGNIGESVVIITETIKHALLPLAALNFGMQKARNYFEKRFPREMSEKAAAIPAEHLTEPKASVAGPALQGLAFSHGEPDIKDMYLSLLATSIDGRTASEAHPAFVEIIKQLTSEEALMLKSLFSITLPMPIASLKLGLKDNQGRVDRYKHITQPSAPLNGNSISNQDREAMVDNWVRLGIIEVDYDKVLHSAQYYAEWVPTTPEHRAIVKEAEENPKFKPLMLAGTLSATAFGLKFAAAVGILSTDKS